MPVRINSSALKHGFTREQISYALDFCIHEEMIDPDNDPPKSLFIGPQDSSGNLLELVGGDLAVDTLLIWHADRCRDDYLKRIPGGEVIEDD